MMPYSSAVVSPSQDVWFVFQFDGMEAVSILMLPFFLMMSLLTWEVYTRNESNNVAKQIVETITKQAKLSL